MTTQSSRQSETAENRSSIARLSARRLRRNDWLSGIISQSRALSIRLQTSTATDLIEHADRLRRFARDEGQSSQDSLLVLAAAGVIEACRRALSVDLFDVQLQTGLIVASGAVAEMQTGEGKTLAVALPAFTRALDGRGVHVATPNDYLARRDREKLAPAFSLLGMTTGLIDDQSSSPDRRAAYRADITYASAHTFGFDYLRDQLTLDGASRGSAADRVYALAAGMTVELELLQRGTWSAIIDEIDHVLIDDAVSPLVLSGAEKGVAPDAAIHEAALAWSERLTVNQDFSLSPEGNVRLTQAGFDCVYADTALTIHAALVRPWHEYIVTALRAKHAYQRDVHYVVREGCVQIVEASTGRVFADRTWSDGLQQAIEVREELEIRPETRSLARITRQRFFRQYRHLAGMTGTATGCEQEFASVYGMPVQIVPPRLNSRRIALPDAFARTQTQKWSLIAAETKSMIDAGRAVLIGTLSIVESLEVAEALTARGIRFELLNGVQDADEAELIARAGRCGAVTVATHLAGRGTDIALDVDVANAGGLHVIVAQKHPIARVDRQLIGRCARCGDPGTARVYVSAEDSIANQHAPWISRAIRRWDDRGRVDSLSLQNQMLRAQTRQQKLEMANRKRLLRSDREDEKLFAKHSRSLSGCWQL